MTLKGIAYSAILIFCIFVLVSFVTMNALCQDTFVTQKDMPVGMGLLSTDQITYYPDGKRILQSLIFGPSDLFYDGKSIKSKDGRIVTSSLPVISVQVLALDKKNIEFIKKTS